MRHPCVKQIIEQSVLKVMTVTSSRCPSLKPDEKILQERFRLSTSLLREHREHTIPLLSILLKASNKMTTTFKLAGLRCTYIQAKQGNGESLR
jgi:hypothetical protein